MVDDDRALFDAVTLRDVTFRNRTVVSPMCQYSAVDGVANDYHLVHLGRFALGGFGLVFVEATSVCPEGRLTYGDLGLWRDDQVAPLARIVDLAHVHGAKVGIQLAHAGAKAATLPPWASEADRPVGGQWAIRSVTDEEYAQGWQKPVSLEREELQAEVRSWADAAVRADRAGADVVELHMAHGYLLHSFLSPVSNTRADEYGGSLEARMRFPLEVVVAVRAAWPVSKPLFVRIAAVDNDDSGITINDSIKLATALKSAGVDVLDCSSGGYGGAYEHPIQPGYQVDWSARIRSGAQVPTVAVGLITEAGQADDIVRTGKADFVALGREALVDPNWPVRAREELEQYEGPERYELLPVQSRSWIGKRQRQIERRANRGSTS